MLFRRCRRAWKRQRVEVPESDHTRPPPPPTQQGAQPLSIAVSCEARKFLGHSDPNSLSLLETSGRALVEDRELRDEAELSI